jgi:8-oxo-dGTP pyrophosphatase MutT (NUDIX family)
MTALGSPDPQPGAGPADGGTPRSQVAALCFRVAHGRTEVLLVTSRDTGRWVLPKGWPMKGRTPAGAAAREAFEEAGVLGRIAEAPLGSYGYGKVMPDGSTLPCRVEVFPLAVRRLVDDYPERRQRVRKWMTPRKAAARVAEPELADLLERFRAEDLREAEAPTHKAGPRRAGKG